ncbi:MAG: glycosyltransferase [Ruminococcus flavefaciens]|nr:glycosyltransferase [Ruminococcus flavefaciens]MCM1061846.1 glycosyltransferase [Eubacterium sp.]
MENILISIITPLHSFDSYFYKCLDCLLGQTLSNMEIIIVDDYSNDNIPCLIKQYLQDPRCKYIRLAEQLGPGGARNKGMEIAKGEYIGFCDSDDWVDLDYYKKATDLLASTQADIAMCGQIREYDTRLNEPIYKCKYDKFMEMNGEMAFQIMSYNYQLDIKVIPPCTNKVYRKTFLENLGVRFQEKVFFQDSIFSVETILKAKKIICVPGVLYHHYKRRNSIIQSFSDKHIIDFENFCVSIREFLLRENLYEKYKRNYYNMMTHFYGIIIREIFEFIIDDELRKKYMIKTFSSLNSVINYNEYIENISAEQLRLHLFPQMNDTTLY